MRTCEALETTSGKFRASRMKIKLEGAFVEFVPRKTNLGPTLYSRNTGTPRAVASELEFHAALPSCCRGKGPAYSPLSFGLLHRAPCVLA